MGGNMTKQRKYCLGSLGRFFILFFCFVFQARAESLGFSLSLRAVNSDNSIQVKVLDDVTLQPIAGAQVSVLDSLGFNETSAVIEAETPEHGIVHFARPFAPHFVIKVLKQGYVSFALAGVQSDVVTIYLKPLQLPNQYSLVHGTLGGWNPSPGKKFVQAGLVFRSLSAMDMLNFQTHTFISPLKDKINIFGEREIPSNVSLPDQVISYLVATVRLNKPQFRVPLYTQRVVRLGAIQGLIKVADVVGGLQGGQFSTELLNKMTVSRIGLTQWLAPAPELKKDFNADYVLTPNLYEVKVTRPPFQSDVMVLGSLDLEGDLQGWVPTDIKTAMSIEEPNQLRPVRLSGVNQSFGNAKPLLIATALGKNAKRMSGILTLSPGLNVQVGEFMAVQEVPDFRTLPNRIVIRAPEKGVGLITFSAEAQGPRFDGGDEVQKDDAQKIKTYNYTTGVVFVLPVAGEIEVPTQTLNPLPAISLYALSQLEFADPFDEKTIDGHAVLQKLSRFTNAFAKQDK